MKISFLIWNTGARKPELVRFKYIQWSSLYQHQSSTNTWIGYVIPLFINFPGSPCDNYQPSALNARSFSHQPPHLAFLSLFYLIMPNSFSSSSLCLECPSWCGKNPTQYSKPRLNVIFPYPTTEPSTLLILGTLTLCSCAWFREHLILL
jgi:hypothetical protein